MEDGERGARRALSMNSPGYSAFDVARVKSQARSKAMAVPLSRANSWLAGCYLLVERDGRNNEGHETAVCACAKLGPSPSPARHQVAKKGSRFVSKKRASGYFKICFLRNSHNFGI